MAGPQPLPFVDDEGRAIRSDALPENKVYQDDGCEVAPKCLECPLSACRYDVPGGIRTLRNIDREAQLLADWRGDGGAEPLTVDELAEKYDVSRRTVFRIVQGAQRNPEGARSREYRPPTTSARPVAPPRLMPPEEERPMGMNDGEGVGDQLDYREFLAYRKASRGRGGKWVRALLEVKLEPMVPVKLPVKASANPSQDKNAIRKAATVIDLKHLDVIAMGEDLWVCVLSESDVEDGAT